MSERGSFVTDYIYCSKCLEVAKTLLLGRGKYLTGVMVPHWSGANGEFMPIIAGKVGALYAGGEIDAFRDEITPLLEREICHPMRIAVLAEQSQEIFEINPK